MKASLWARLVIPQKKKTIYLKKPIFLKSGLTSRNDILTVLFFSCWFLYDNFHSFILGQCQNSCPTVTQVILDVLFWIQHNSNVLLILLLLSHKDLKLRPVSWTSPRSTLVSNLTHVTRAYRFQVSTFSRNCLISIIETEKHLTILIVEEELPCSSLNHLQQTPKTLYIWDFRALH